ncbi:hypothetical protein HPG69_006345 [Diceros bicornis minor]|uniref:Uncharacterized protein n=1 Tax=Diceros bicornis minor TaxID=77932 RepID=A0A7J7FLD7_DICBM|nr:hypothetical protein HPG69_006345 [Diceros bicornis minor]
MGGSQRESHRGPGEPHGKPPGVFWEPVGPSTIDTPAPPSQPAGICPGDLPRRTLVTMATNSGTSSLIVPAQRGRTGKTGSIRPPWALGCGARGLQAGALARRATPGASRPRPPAAQKVRRPPTAARQGTGAGQVRAGAGQGTASRPPTSAASNPEHLAQRSPGSQPAGPDRPRGRRAAGAGRSFAGRGPVIGWLRAGRGRGGAPACGRRGGGDYVIPRGAELAAEQTRLWDYVRKRERRREFRGTGGERAELQSERGGRRSERTGRGARCAAVPEHAPLGPRLGAPPQGARSPLSQLLWGARRAQQQQRPRRRRAEVSQGRMVGGRPSLLALLSGPRRPHLLRLGPPPPGLPPKPLRPPAQTLPRSLLLPPGRCRFPTSFWTGRRPARPSSFCTDSSAAKPTSTLSPRPWPSRQAEG